MKWFPSLGVTLLGAAIVLSPGDALAQGTVTGLVTDSRTGQPMVAAQVSLEGTQVGGLTNNSGRYLIAGVPVGTHTLEVQRIGFTTVTREVTVTAGGTAVVDVEMTEQAVALGQIIVTGVAGGTERRAIGNAVSTLSTEALTLRTDIENMQQLLHGRTPGVTMTRVASGVGTGGGVRIRGVSSMSLSGMPLIFVDGVRVDNNTNTGPTQVTGGGRATALDDFVPADIERIEIVKGPAAATLYGTEASAGVIQIITKRGESGAPRFDVAITQGLNFLNNPSDRLGDTYGLVNGEVVQFGYDGDRTYRNLYEYEKEVRGNDVLQYGPRHNYELSVRGGTDLAKYFLSGGYERSEGMVSYNWQERANIRANINAVLGQFSLDASTGYVESTTSFGTPIQGEDLWRMLFWGQVHTQNNPKDRGFLRGLPEEFETLESMRDLSRFTGSVVVTHRMLGDRLTQRLTGGLDRSSEESYNLIPFDPLGTAARWGTRNLGEITMWRPLTTVQTLDYSASFKHQLTDWFAFTSSFGAQYYSREFDQLQAFGRFFAAPPIRSIAGAAETSITQNFEPNKSVGLYVQQELNFNDRMFFTAAVRGDDNSAFGTDYDAAIYPKFSGSWVVSDESFWNVDAINTLRLRAAWGKAGRQPATFAATTIYGKMTGPGGAPAVHPQTLGNPLLGPEVSSELELGFEVAAFNDRVGLDFTHFRQKTVDALTNFPLPPSSGFGGSTAVNIGRLDNWGYELSVNTRAVEQESFSLDVDFYGSYTMNEIKDLGGRPPTTTLREGFPFPAVSSDIIRWAELDATGKNGKVSTMICDGGTGPNGLRRGGADVLCTTMVGKKLLLGPRFEPWTYGMNTTATVGPLQAFVAIDGRTGGWNQNNNHQGAHLGAYNSTLASNLRNDPAYLKTRLQPSTTPSDQTISILYPDGFLKLREVGVLYRVPSRFAEMVGSSAISLSGSAREVGIIWRQAQEISSGAIEDPESQGGADGFTTFYGGFPPLSSFTLTLRAQF